MRDGRLKIRGLSVRDIRFPTSGKVDQNEAQLIHPRNFACAYVALFTDQGTKGFGLTVTPGPGTEIVVQAIRSLSKHVVGEEFHAIIKNFRTFCKKLTDDPHLRWMGTEKGVVHLAASAVINAIWDLWGRLENKPVWKILTDMSPQDLVAILDFSYLEDALTEQEALDILKSMEDGKESREDVIRANGFPCYTDAGGCLGHEFEVARNKLQYAIQSGFSRFKIEVGFDVESTKERLAKIRQVIGPDRLLMLDANQTWEAEEAIEWVHQLAEFNPTWIEEPTSPDDVLGHAKIAKALKPLGLGLAVGQHCHNRVMFKQLFLANALSYCQIDPCRLGGVNECVVVMLMAKKFGIPVCPHAGGIGLGEMGQHLATFNFISISGDRRRSFAEYSNHLHEHFMQPAKVKHGNYVVPEAPGYSLEMITSSLLNYEYPNGPVWHQAVLETKHNHAQNIVSRKTSNGHPRQQSPHSNGLPQGGKSKSLVRNDSSSSISDVHYYVQMEERRGQMSLMQPSMLMNKCQMVSVGSISSLGASVDNDSDAEDGIAMVAAGRDSDPNLPDYTGHGREYTRTVSQYLPVESALFQDYF